MKIFYEYSHLGGKEILQVRFPGLCEEIQEALAVAHPKGAMRRGRKKPHAEDRVLLETLEAQLAEALRERGWRALKDTFPLNLPGYPSAFRGQGVKQVDVAKEGVLIGLGFDQYSSVFHDLGKFQHFYNAGLAEVGVEILPAAPLASHMEPGAFRGEWLVHDLQALQPHFPVMPVWVVLIAPDDEERP